MSLKTRIIVGLAVGGCLALAYPVVVVCVTGGIVTYGCAGMVMWGTTGFAIGFVTGDCEKSANVVTKNFDHRNLERGIKESEERFQYRKALNL